MDFLDPLKNRIISNLTSIIVGFTIYQLNNLYYTTIPKLIGSLDACPGTTETDVRQLILITYSASLYRNLLGFVRKNNNI